MNDPFNYHLFPRLLPITSIIEAAASANLIITLVLFYGIILSVIIQDLFQCLCYINFTFVIGFFLKTFLGSSGLYSAVGRKGGRKKGKWQRSSDWDLNPGQLC